MNMEIIKKIPDLQAALRGALVVYQKCARLIPPSADGDLPADRCAPPATRAKAMQDYWARYVEYRQALEVLATVRDPRMYGILAMHYVGGMSYPAIARELGGRHTSSSVQQECSRFFSVRRRIEGGVTA